MTGVTAGYIRRALTRGWRKRCPHCGKGHLFGGRWKHIDKCAHCGLVYERNPGDTWAFTIIGDRLPIAIIIVIVYFGLVRQHRAIGLTVIALLGALIVWSAPNRWGVGIALHYLSRRFWPDPQDPIPPDARQALKACTTTVGRTNIRCDEQSYVVLGGVVRTFRSAPEQKFLRNSRL